MDNNKLWKDVISALRVSLSAPTLQTWFLPSHIVSVKKLSDERQVVEVGCPSSFIARGLEERYFDLLRDTLNEQTGIKNDLLVLVKQKPVLENRDTGPLFSANEPVESDNTEVDAILKKARVRSGFTFGNFAVSTTNQMAHAAAEAVSRTPGSAYNPLFLYGGVGVGKTHLMLAVAHRLVENKQDSSILYCMGEEFTNEIVEAIRNKTTQAFKNRYRNYHVCLID